MAGTTEKTEWAGPVASVPEELTGQPRRVVTARWDWRHTFVALRHRNFRLFFVGQLISLIGTWMQSTAQSWLVYELTGSKLWLGVVAAAGTAPMLVFSILGGSAADRYPKRGIVVLTQSAMMVLAFVLAGLAWLHLVRPPHLVVLAVLGGIAMAFDMPARQSFLMEITSREDLMNAISLNSSIVNMARVAGPAVAGVLMARLGVAICFLLNGISFLAVIGGLLLMRLPAAGPRPAPARGHVREGFRYVWGHRRIKTVLILFGITVIFGWSYSVLLPAFAAEVLRVGEHGYGMLLSANGVGALGGALTVAAVHRLFRPRVLAFTGLWLFTAMLLSLAFTRSYALALTCLAIGGWGMMLFFATANTVVQSSAADAMRGRVMGIWALVFGGMTPVGSLEAGVLAQHLGVPRTIAFGALTCAAAAGVTLWHIRRTPEERSPA